MELKGKTAVITGGASGIGKETAKLLANYKVNILLFDLNDPINTQQEIIKLNVKCVSFIGDVTKSEDLRAAFQKAEELLGPVSIWINNAGIAEKDLFPFLLEENFWKKVININLTSMIAGTQIACKEFKKHDRSGVIINVASMAGIFPVPLTPVYAATKAGIVNFTRSLNYLGASGIRVNAVCPSFTQTPMIHEIPSSVTDAAGGILEVTDISTAILELITDQSKAGAILTVTKVKGKTYWPISKPVAKL